MARGAGKAILDQAQESIGVVGDIVNGETKARLIEQIDKIKQSLAKYTQNGEIQFEIMKNDIIGGM